MKNDALILTDLASKINTAHRLATEAMQAGLAHALEAGKLIYVSVDDDKERALATLKPFIADYYGPRIDIAEHGVYGPPVEVAAQLRRFVDAGVTTFMLGVPTLDIDHIERIAKDVVPRLQG